MWVDITGTATTALDRQALTVSLCGPDAGGLTLGPGTHTLRSTLGQLSGFDIDQLALDSAPGGGPMPLASPTDLAAPTVAPAPQVAVTSETATSLDLSVTGVGPGATASPFDLVLGESNNTGWKAAVVGGSSLGPPILVDGFANGWRVDPATLGGALHDGTLHVVLTWQPQREIDVALVVSALTVVACLLIVLLPMVRRRRRKRRVHAVRPTEPAGGTTGGPVLAVPFSAESPRAPVWVALIAGVVAGALAAVIAGKVAGTAVGAATLLVLLVPRLRIILGLAALAGIVMAGIYTAVHQAQFHVPANGGWPTKFQVASRWAWAGAVFLGAEGVVDIVFRRRQAKEQTDSDAAPRAPGPNTG